MANVDEKIEVFELCSEVDIKKAYRVAALWSHPDKVISATSSIQAHSFGSIDQDASHIFKLIGEAYEILSDRGKRAEYDVLEDERQRENVHFSEVDDYDRGRYGYSRSYNTASRWRQQKNRPWRSRKDFQSSRSYGHEWWKD